MDDWELLEAYAGDRSEAAFGELVRRHLAWVYSVAFRHIGNSALAKDVTQSVFVLLAQKAGSLPSGVVLGGWLFRTTRFVGNRALRAERRRKNREEMAASMIPSTTSPDENEAVWKLLEPHLDEAVGALSEADRQAILLRFYEKQPLLEIGRHLGLSEEAAKKRVSRAIQKLRDFLVRRGVTVGATVLTGFLATQTVQAVPAGLAVSVLKTAAAGVAPAGVLPQLAQETVNAWRWTQLKIAGGITAALCGLVWMCLVVPPHVPAGSSSTGKPEIVQPEGERPTAAVAAAPAAPTHLPAKTPGRAMHFRVVASDSGEPVGGAALAVNTASAEGWKQRFDLATDENGSAEIPFPPGSSRLDVGVMASGWAARFATWRPDTDPEIPTEYTMRVTPVTNYMGGWLLDSNGQPVANAVVEVLFAVGDMAQEETPRERDGFVRAAPVSKSDQNGWWSCGVVGPNAKRLPIFRARHPDYAVTEIFSGSWGPPGAGEIQTVKLLWSGKLVTTMNRGVTLNGRILAEDGQPIGGALIEHEPSSFEPIRAETDALGWFTISGLPSGAFDFIVTAPGFAQNFVQLSLEEGEKPVEVRLKPGGILRLRLVDEDGKAVANATAALTGPGGTYVPGMNWRAQSGQDGRVEWTSAPTNGRLNIFASKSPEFAMAGALLEADGEEHLIRLRRALVVTGRVTDAQTGELIPGEIKAFPGYGAGESSWFRGSTWRSTDGTYRVYFNEPGWTINDNHGYRFRIEAEGYSPFISGWLDRSSNSVVDVTLQPADPSKTVRGTVWRTDGQPAAGAEVGLLCPEHGLVLGMARFADRSALDRLIVNADAAGKFAFSEEPSAAFVVAVCSNGFARVTVGDQKSALEMHLQPWGRVEGTIDPSARNRPIAQVQIGDLRSLNPPGNLSLDARCFHLKPTEEDRFAFEFMPSGPWCVWLDAGVIEEHQVPPYHHPTWIQVAPGETTPVKIAETGYRVKGRLVLAGREGEAFKQPTYALLESDSSPELATSTRSNTTQWSQWVFDSGWLIIGPNGEFESRHAMTPGTYRLLGRIEDVSFDQLVEVPNPREYDFLNLGNGPGAVESSVIDLGDIMVAGKENMTPQRH